MRTRSRLLGSPPTITNNHITQVLAGLQRGSECFDDLVFPDDEGFTFLPYADRLTYDGETNKLATNIALGRYVRIETVGAPGLSNNNNCP